MNFYLFVETPNPFTRIKAEIEIPTTQGFQVFKVFTGIFTQFKYMVSNTSPL